MSNMVNLQPWDYSWMHLNDAQLAAVVPVFAYWTLSLTFHFIDQYNLFEKYRIYPSLEETKRNLATKKQVLSSVLFQQAFQVTMGLTIGHYESNGDHWEPRGNSGILLLLQEKTQPVFANCRSWMILCFPHWVLAVLFYGARQLLACLVIDAWQFWIHRLEHSNTWIYRNIHSRHHRLYTPYAYGALYNHPLETLCLDTLGGLVSAWAIGLSHRESMVFFTLSTLKTVDDHCGYQLPWDIVQWFGKMTGNDVVYHNVHHQSWGLKSMRTEQSNYALFFTFWDDMLATKYSGASSLRKPKAE